MQWIAKDEDSINATMGTVIEVAFQTIMPPQSSTLSLKMQGTIGLQTGALQPPQGGYQCLNSLDTQPKVGAFRSQQ